MDLDDDQPSSHTEGDGLKRKRSRRKELIENIKDKVKGRRKSGHQIDVGAALAFAGHTYSALGGEAAREAAKTNEILRGLAATRNEILRGAEVFVRELNAVTDAQSFHAQSTTSLQTAITVADVRSEALEDDLINSPTDNNNPFEWSSDEDDDSSDLDPFVENICVPSCTGTQDIFMRALLDTGMKVNAMAESKWRKTGFKREKYLGHKLVTANGDTFYPQGQVKIQFYFRRRQSARSWELRFLIVPDEAPFDVALGRKFIRKAKLLERNEEALPLKLKKLTPEERAEVDRKTREAEEEQYEIKERQAEERERRKREQRERNSGRNRK